MQRCRTCGSEFADGLEECPSCGPETGEVYRCARCGEHYDETDACPACGELRERVGCEAHPQRAATGRCVLCGRAVCELCRADDRRAHLCEDHASVVVIEGWAQVYSTRSEFAAQLVRDNLKAEGIDAQIYSQRDRIFSVDVGELSIVRLLVPVWEYEQAVELIRNHLDAEGEVAFACPGCGEVFEAGSRECTACGAPLA